MSDPFDPDGMFQAPGERFISKEPRYYGKTQKALMLVERHGVDPADALRLATGNPTPNPATLTAFRKKAAAYSLSRPSMVKLAHSVVKDTMSGKCDQIQQQKVTSTGQVVDFIENIAPTHTNKLAAAAMVFDRVEPVVRQNINLNGNLADFMPVKLECYE
jgi:hypothetical protein